MTNCLGENFPCPECRGQEIRQRVMMIHNSVTTNMMILLWEVIYSVNTPLSYFTAGVPTLISKHKAIYSPTLTTEKWFQGREPLPPCFALGVVTVNPPCFALGVVIICILKEFLSTDLGYRNLPPYAKRQFTFVGLVFKGTHESVLVAPAYLNASLLCARWCGTVNSFWQLCEKVYLLSILYIWENWHLQRLNNFSRFYN